MTGSNKSQLDKFKAAAKEAECKMGPRKFDEALGNLAKSKKADPNPLKSKKPKHT